VNGYANLIAARLRKLADEGSTGMLPVSGRGDGAVFFRGGRVVYAESSRTARPGLHPSGLAALGLTHDEGHAGEAGLVAPGPGGALAGMLELTELIVDALADLLCRESRYAKFRPAQVRPAGPERPMPVEELLAEVQRRHEVQRQLAAVVTADSAVTLNPSLDPPLAQVSPAQWALLARAADGTTPRGLALQIGRSVFGTTIEVYRLLELGLLVVPGRPPAGHRGSGTALSFLRAVPAERRDDDEGEGARAGSESGAGLPARRRRGK